MQMHVCNAVIVTVAVHLACNNNLACKVSQATSTKDKNATRIAKKRKQFAFRHQKKDEKHFLVFCFVI